MEHAFTCPCGGFPSIRHNEVRDLTASLLSGYAVMLLSQLSNLSKVNHCNLLLPIEKMVPALMLLPGIFGVIIGSVHFLIFGCLTLLRAPIFIPNYPNVTSYMNVRNDMHMMNMLDRLRELAFCL